MHQDRFSSMHKQSNRSLPYSRMRVALERTSGLSGPSMSLTLGRRRECVDFANESIFLLLSFLCQRQRGAPEYWVIVKNVSLQRFFPLVEHGHKQPHLALSLNILISSCATMECPPHTVISCESASLVHRLLLFYPVHSYIVWDNGKTREIIVRISLLEGTLPRSTDACFRHIPLLTTLEADLKAAGFASATCAFPPPPPIPPSWIPLPPPSVANSEQQQQPPVNWLRFPSDIWKIIFGKLQLVDLLRSRVVCKVLSHCVHGFHHIFIATSHPF